MTTATASAQRSVGTLADQTVVVIGGSSGIGLAAARQARSAGAALVLTGRDPERLEDARKEVAAVGTALLDISDAAGLELFFAGLPARIDHVLVTGGGPTYSSIADLDFAEALTVLDEHLLGSLRIARACAGRLRPGASLSLIPGTRARRPGSGLTSAAIAAAAIPAIVANV